jgi:hypothetical protein
VSERAYNHYTMLGSVEKIFGLSYLGYAGLPHSTYFGTDIYKRPCGPAPPVITGRVNQAYRFRVRGVDTAGEVGKWAATELASTT